MSDEHDSRPTDGATEAEGASWKNEAIDESLAKLRAELDAEKQHASGAKQKALEKGESLIDDIENALEKRVD